MQSLQFLVLMILINEAAAIAELSDFFLYGNSVHDTRLHPNDDEYSPPQNISVEFTFFTERHSRLYVNTNGLVSFKYGVRQYVSTAFPNIGSLTILSPFWADIETSYCEPDCSIWYRESSQLRDLEKATYEVRKYFPVMKHFEATWTYIVTWYNVARFNAQGNELKKRNTFQAVLITDNESAFAIYYYNKIQWTGTNPAQVGFNMGDNFHFYSVEGSRTADIINLPHLTNVKDPGTFAFRVDLKDIQEAPPPGEPGKCYLKAADLVLVLDLSLSINKTMTKNLIKDLIDYLPINEYEFQVAMATFSENVQRDFYFDDNKSRDDIKYFVDNVDVVSSTSNLEAALMSVRQMFMYNYRGSRSYAKKFALIFTDGLMPDGSLIAHANNLKSLTTVAMVGIGESVRHTLLDTLATDKNVLSPNPEKIWKYLQTNLAQPSCLVCAPYASGNVFIMLDDSFKTTENQFSEGKHFITTFLFALRELTPSNVNTSIDVIGQNHTSVIPIQNIRDFKERVGVLSLTDYRGGFMNFALMEQFFHNAVHQNVNNGFIVFVSSGHSLELSIINKLKYYIQGSKLTVITVGLGNKSNWDNLEILASSGYFVFDSIDASLAARYIANELKIVTCT